MADPLAITGVVGVVVQILQLTVHFGLDWKDAPGDAKSFAAELHSLKTVLLEAQKNIVSSQQYADAFNGQKSAVLSQLQTHQQPSDTQTMLSICETGLTKLLHDLKKRAQGHSIGWERFKGAFLAKRTREAVQDLQRQCQLLNGLFAIDALTLGAAVHNEIKMAREEKHNWQEAESERTSTIKAGVDQIYSSQQDYAAAELRKSALEWLTPIDYAAQQNDFIQRRQAGTGQWLLESQEYTFWLRTKGQTLFCPGIPGAGKTTLASIVIQDLLTRYQHDYTAAIAYIYFKYNRKHEQNLSDLLASLLKQLAESQPHLPEAIQKLYEDHQKSRSRPSVQEISDALKKVLSYYSRVFLVVDALDECQTSNACRSQFLSELFSLEGHQNANLLTTSRALPDVVRTFEGKTSLEIRASREDIQIYIDSHLTQLPSCVHRNDKLKEEIAEVISEAIDGMFLLAQLFLNSLKDKTTPKIIRKTLKQYQQQNQGVGEENQTQVLENAYRQTMVRIESQEEGFKSLAIRVLSWITCAERPLSTTELQHALAVEVGEDGLDEENLTPIGDMVSVCAGLVTIDHDSDIIRLVHYTTKEYFDQARDEWFRDAQGDIVTTCVTYLSFSSVESGIAKSKQELEDRRVQNPFYEYAACNWGHHARKCSLLAQQVESFLACQLKVQASWQMLMHLNLNPVENYHQQFSTRVTEFHVAAFFGIEKAFLAASSLHTGEVDWPDSSGRTPLSWAAGNGHEAVAKLLLEAQVETESKDTGYGRTPLSWAADNGHEAVTKLLLEAQADIESEDVDGRTPLSLAAEDGHEAVAKLLLEAQADIESKDSWYGGTPLFWAADNRHEAVARLLVKANADIESQDCAGLTPLSCAAFGGHEAMVTLLLEAQADIESEDVDGRTPLSLAAVDGHEAVAKLLLEAQADIESEDVDGRTPLSLAAEGGHEAVAKLLLEYQADIESKDFHDRTPLSWAARNGHEAVAKLLLEAQAYVEPKDFEGRTPLSWAAGNGYEAMVKLLLKAQADVESKDFEGRTPLSWAARNGHEAVAKLLLEA